MNLFEFENEYGTFSFIESLSNDQLKVLADFINEYADALAEASYDAGYRTGIEEVNITADDVDEAYHAGYEQGLEEGNSK